MAVHFEVWCSSFHEHRGTVNLAEGDTSWQPGCRDCLIAAEATLPAAAHWHGDVLQIARPCPFVGCPR